MKVTVIPIIVGALGKSPKALEREKQNQKKNQDHTDSNIVGSGPNKEKNPEDPIRPAVSQTPVWEHQLKLMLKTRKKWYNYNNNNIEETCCHSNSTEKPSANTDVKNSKGVNNDNDNDNNKVVTKQQM